MGLLTFICKTRIRSDSRKVTYDRVSFSHGVKLEQKLLPSHTSKRVSVRARILREKGEAFEVKERVYHLVTRTSVKPYSFSKAPVVGHSARRLAPIYDVTSVVYV